MATLFNPVVWLQWPVTLSRAEAAVLLAVSALLIVLGLRAFRLFLCLALGIVGYTLGLQLAKAMYVRGLYVAIPAAAIAVVVTWFMHIPLRILIIAACSAGLGSYFIAHGFEMPHYYWQALAAFAIVGAILALIAPRFSVTLLCAIVGTTGFLTALGSLIRAAKGPFAVGGFSHYPTEYLGTGTAFFVASIVLQVVLDSDGGGALSLQGNRI